MMEHARSAYNLLRLVRQDTDAIGVAVSFGKDSLVTLDLCCRVFARVEGYYLYRVRGMRIVDEWAADVRRRFGVTVRMYPHFDLSRCYRHAVLAPHWSTEAAKVDMSDIERQFRAGCNVSWIAYGWRRNDSFSRALIMKQTGGYDPASKRVFPIRSWTRRNVHEYLSFRGIPLPNGLGRKDQGGLDFHPAALAYLKEHYPDDYRLWMTDFPFSVAQEAISSSDG